MHLFLSPHPDDVAFSCGGRIAQLVRAGEAVTIYTVMGGSAPSDFRSSPYTDEHFARWGTGPTANDAVRVRQQEDKNAADALGAQIAYGTFSDCIYRMHGDHLYDSVEKIFGAIHPQDPATPDALQSALIETLGVPTGPVYSPLGIGHHVDHQLTRAMAFNLAQRFPDLKVYFYEDVPYALKGRRVIVDALQGFGQPLLRVNYAIDSDALAAKIKASACYKSQLSSFWQDDAEMQTVFETFNRENDGENYWRLLRDDSIDL